MDVDALGTLGIRFSDGTTLEVFPDESAIGEEYAEQWRLLEPDSSSPHLVMTTRGIEPPVNP